MVNKDEIRIIIQFIKDNLSNNLDKSIIINKFQLDYSYSEHLKEIVYILKIGNLSIDTPTEILKRVLNSLKTMTNGDAIDFITKALENQNEFLSLLNEGYNLYVNE